MYLFLVGDREAEFKTVHAAFEARWPEDKVFITVVALPGSRFRVLRP